MRILIDSSCGRVGDGISSSLFWVPDTEVITWTSDAKPTMDMFDEANPDILIINATQLSTPELKIASHRHPNTKIVSIGKVNDFQLEPHLSIQDSSSQFPTILFEDGAMIGNIGRPSKKKNLHTDLLCLTDYIPHGNIPTNAAQVPLSLPHLSKEAYEYFIEESPLKEALSILSFLCENYNIKIFGNQKAPFPHYLGTVDSSVRSSALASTSVYIDLDGGSWYDAAWLGKECVSISKSCARHFNNIEELKASVDEALAAGETNSQKIKMTVKNQTYFELTGDILSFFNLPEKRQLLMNKKKEMLC